MANKHLNSCSTSLVIRETLIRKIQQYNAITHLLEEQKKGEKKRQGTISIVGEDAVHLELSHIVGENAEWHSYSKKKSLAVSYKVNHIFNHMI